MAISRYALTDYILSVQVPDELQQYFVSDTQTTNNKANVISIGGNGSYIGSITIGTQAEAQWTTNGDSTGSWVHNKNLNRVGTITISINQVSDTARLLLRLFQTYYSADASIGGLTLTISKSMGNSNPIEVCKGRDCYIANRPQIAFGETAQQQDWSFTCGEITFSTQTL